LRLAVKACKRPGGEGLVKISTSRSWEEVDYNSRALWSRQ